MKRQTTHRLFGALLLSTSVTTALTLTTGAAGADTCTDITFDGPTLDEPNAGYTLPVNVTIPAGVVVLVPEAVSTDEGDGRADAPAQTSERWDLEFLDGSNGVAGRSGVTEDLADGVGSATWTGELNGAFVVSPVVAVRARHRPDLGDRTTNDDVTAVSVTLCWGEPATRRRARPRHRARHRPPRHRRARPRPRPPRRRRARPRRPRRHRPPSRQRAAPRHRPRRERSPQRPVPRLRARRRTDRWP